MVEKNYQGAIFFKLKMHFSSASPRPYMHGKLSWAQPNTEALKNPGDFFSD